MNNKFLRGIAVILIAVLFMTTGVVLKIYSNKGPEGNIVPNDQVESSQGDNGGDEGDRKEEDEGQVEIPVVEKLAFVEAPQGYYNDALFIGDSRCVGLKKYAPKEGATYFVSTGLNVFTVESTVLNVDNFGNTSLENLLKSNTYGKIYIMLGINELGYEFNSTCVRYKELISNIKKLQPDSIVIINANLRVTQSKSKSDKLYNNTNINRLNDAISKFANDTDVAYIDVNPIFDDGYGNLGAEYTGDHVHLYANYYPDWSAWLDTVAVVKEAS